MDPLSITAFTASAIGFVAIVSRKIAGFIDCYRNADASVEEFRLSITNLETVLTSIEKTFRNRRRHQSFEQRHWEVIRDIIYSLRGCLSALDKAIPETTSRSSESFNAFMLQWKSELIATNRAHIASYTQCLQISLTTAMLSSQWEAQDRQYSLGSQIQQLSDDIERTYHEHKPPDNVLSDTSYSTSEDADIMIEKQMAFRNLKDWVSSTRDVTRAISCKAPSTASGSARGSNLPRPVEGVNNSKTSEPSEGSGIDSYPESINTILESGGPEAEWDLEYEGRFQSPQYSIEDLDALIKEHQHTIDFLIDAQLYKAAEEHLKKLIHLLKQRGGEDCEEVTTSEEKLARVLYEQRTKRSFIEALAILKKLLASYVTQFGDEDVNRRRDSSIRASSIKFSLASIYLEQGRNQQALIYALEALKDRQNSGAETASIDDSYEQVASIHDQTGDFTAAIAMRRRMQKQPRVPISSGFDVLCWLKNHGFIVHEYRRSSGTSRQSSFQTDYVNTLHPLTRQTPLQYAIIREEEPNIIRTLLARGAAKELVDEKGATPLILAAGTRNKNIVEALLEYGVDTAAIDNDGSSVLHAVQTPQGGVKAARLLLQACIPQAINAQDKRGRTPLHLAASFGNEPMVEELLANQPVVDINATDCAHDTPLHLAIHARHKESLIHLLVDKGASVTLRNVHGKDALQVAKAVQPRMESVVAYMKLQKQSAGSRQADRERKSAYITRNSSTSSQSSNITYGLPEINQSTISLPFSTQGSVKSSKRGSFVTRYSQSHW